MKFNEIKVKEDNLSSRKHIRHEKLDHEVHMAKSDLVALAQDSRDLLMLLQKYGSDEKGIPGWIASKITKAQDYIKSVHKSLSYDSMDGEISEDDINEAKFELHDPVRSVEKMMQMLEVDSPADIIADIKHWCDHNNKEFANIEAIGDQYYTAELRAGTVKTKANETASAGSTSAGSIATIANPHITKYKGPKPKKQKPSDNALDMKNASIFGGPIKRK